MAPVNEKSPLFAEIYIHSPKGVRNYVSSGTQRHKHGPKGPNKPPGQAQN